MSHVTGVPNPENLTLLALSVTSVLLCWNHPPASDANCPLAEYVITITTVDLPQDPRVIYTSNNVTNMTVCNLTQGMEYAFTVAGMGAGGRVEENNAPKCKILLDSELVV